LDRNKQTDRDKLEFVDDSRSVGDKDR